MSSNPRFPQAMAFLSRATPRRIRPVHALLLIIVISIVFLSRSHRQDASARPSIYTYTDGKTSRPWNELFRGPRVSAEAAWLDDVVEGLAMPKDVRYYSVRIKPLQNDTRPTVSEVDTPFMHGGFRGVRSDHEGLRLKAEHMVPVPVAPGVAISEVDAGALLFGMSASYARIMLGDGAIMNDWTRWLTDGTGKSNGATLVLTLRQADEVQVETVRTWLKDAGVDAVVSSDEAPDGPSRYLGLVKQLTVRQSPMGFEGFPEKKYLAMVDDDAFFPDMSKLLKSLEAFDPTESHYIGMPSERADWVVDAHETVTYGGGAIFFTASAAVKISQLPCLRDAGLPEEEQETSKVGFMSQWDYLLYQCVSSYTDMTMRVLPSFYLPSDEALGSHFFNYDLGIAPLALHRARSRHLLDPAKATALSALINPSTFLQRYRFSDDWILVNGHTLSHYPHGSSTAKLGSEAVQHKDSADRAAALQPMNANLAIEEGARNPREWDVVTWAGSRRVWNLADARRDEATGEVWQAYVRRKGEPGQYTDGRRNEDKSGSDYVVVLIWEGAVTP